MKIHWVDQACETELAKARLNFARFTRRLPVIFLLECRPLCQYHGFDDDDNATAEGQNAENLVVDRIPYMGGYKPA